MLRQSTSIYLVTVICLPLPCFDDHTIRCTSTHRQALVVIHTRNINVPAQTPLLTVTWTVNWICVAQSSSIHLVGTCFNGQRTITDTVTSTTGGCDTIRTLNLTVTPLLTVTRTLMFAPTSCHIPGWTCVQWCFTDHRYRD